MANFYRFFSIILFLLILWLTLFNCDSHSLNEIINTTPKFVEKEFISMKKLYSIDITNLTLCNEGGIATNYDYYIDFDKNNNMYVLDVSENTITVFNDRGKKVKTFGRTGQGPGEFSRSSALIINDEKIYVFEALNYYKIVNLEGEYITKQYIPWINRLKLEIVGDVFCNAPQNLDR